MPDSLGHHLLIDLYACLEDTLSSPLMIQESVTNALEAAHQRIDEINCQVIDDEVILLALSPRCHVAVHAYPHMGYAAVDIYTFDIDVRSALLMKELKQAFGAERVKATSVQRGDFGSERDMKPRKKTSLSPLARVTRTRTSLKKTGNKLKNTGAKVFRVITKKTK